MPKQETSRLGRFTMDIERRRKLRAGIRKYKSSPTAANIRIKAITGTVERWGVSADENVRTQLLRTRFKNMGRRERRFAYMQRSHQGVLVFRTRSRVLRKTYGEDVKKAKFGISSHTPGIKTQVSPGTKGAITDEHGTRDNVRARAVETTLNDSKRHRYDVGTVGKLGTIQLMMSPQEEFDRVRSSVVGKNKPSIHSVFDKVGDVSTKKGFRRLTSNVHEVREREKLEAASMLLASGKKPLVPKGHRQLLKHSGGNIDTALELLRTESTKSSPSLSFNTATHSQTDRLDQYSLRRMSRRAERGKPGARALSPPRRVGKRSSSFPFG